MAHSFNLSPTGSLSWNAPGTKIHAPTSGTLSISAETKHIFHTAGTDRMIVTAGGSVGIGTNDPSEKLEVAGSAAGDGALIGNAKIGVWTDTDYAMFSHKDLISDGSCYALLQKSDGNTQLNAADGQKIDFTINNDVTDIPLTINSNKRISIRTTSTPEQVNMTGKLAQASVNTATGGKSNNFNYRANIYGYYEPSDSTMRLYFRLDDASGGGVPANFYSYITNSGTNPSPLTFTGQHRNLMNTSIGTSQDGLIVSATDKIINVNNSISPTINESLPYCVLSNTDNDKKVFGVISTKEDNNKSRDYATGAFVSVYNKENINEERMFINSLGEGAVWVSNKNGSLEIGDFIVSTTTPGYGGKQADGSLHNYTVAKMTCNCDFSLTKIVKLKLKTVQTSEGQELVYDSSGNPEYENDLDPDGNIQMVYKYQTRFLQADGTLLVDQTDYETRLSNGETVYIACFVGCTYHCG